MLSLCRESEIEMRSRIRRMTWILLLGLLAGSLFVLPGAGITLAAPLAAPGQGNVVISEFRSSGPAGDGDEFVELFNPTASSIGIGGWRIRSISNSGSMMTRLTIPTGTSLDAGQHYLAATSASGLARDGTMSTGIAYDGGVALTLADGTSIVDKAGMSPAAAEGTPLGEMSGLVDQSYERQAGGSQGSCYDSDQNSYDFALISPSDPQTTGSDLIVCSPATDTPSATSSSTSSPSPSVTPTASDTPTPSPSGSPTDSPTPSSTVTTTDTPTSTPTPSATATPTPTATPSASPTTTSTPSPTASASSTPTPSATGSATATPTATATPSVTRTASATAGPPTHLVISEFRSRGPNGSDDEFVELYNPSGGAVNISSWSVRRSVSCGMTIYTMAALPSGTILLAGQHYLLASTNASISDPDQFYTAALADDGGLALVSSSGSIVDQVGMCSSTQYREATTLAPLTGNSNQSYERRLGGDTACVDNNNNATDFTLLEEASPQSKAYAISLCSGVVTYTPTRTPTRSPTRTPSPVPTAYPGVVAINEFLPHQGSDWNGDGATDVGDEYIELINMGTGNINLNNWKLDDDGAGGSAPYTLPETILMPRQIAVFFASETGLSLSDGGDTVRLIKPDGRTADLFNYPVVSAADQTWCRLPDGNGDWAFACRPSPARPNSAYPTLQPGNSADGGAPAPCWTAAPAPDFVRLIECLGTGTGAGPGTRLWFKDRFKWEVFVE